MEKSIYKTKRLNSLYSIIEISLFKINRDKNKISIL